MMLPQAVFFACATAVDVHRDAVAALIPRNATTTLWQFATTTKPIVNGGPGGVFSALEQLPATVVEEVQAALSGRLPDVQVPPSVVFGHEALPSWLGPTELPRRASEDSVLASTRYVCEVAPQRVQILLQIVQALMPQLVRDAQGRSDEDRSARHLAVAVIVASALSWGIRAYGIDSEQAAIGLGLGVWVVLARVMARLAVRVGPVAESPSPAHDKRPAPPTMVSVPATGSRILLCDFGTPDPPDATPDAAFAANGLVVAIAGGLVIRSGSSRTLALVTLSVVNAEPEAPHAKWQEVVDVSFTTATDVSLVGSGATLSLPGHGDYRARVHARRRDVGVEEGDNAGEEYEIVVWPAPEAPERVLVATDRLGHRLRGEPEPAPVDRPEVAFRPIADLFLDGATLTVTVGSTLEQVVRSFGAGAVPHPTHDLYDDLFRPVEFPSRTSEQPAILVVEPSNYRGSEKSVLEESSRRGRAASIYWNVNAVTRLSVAENGELLDAFEWWDQATHPTVLDLFEGLDIYDYEDKVARGLVVIERFTGCTVTEDLVSQMEAMTVGYRVSR